jgi:hypothetical protein
VSPGASCLSPTDRESQRLKRKGNAASIAASTIKNSMITIG